jgi:deazaflavin-dependent oxidoreductase (nitroreductase family)
VGDYGAVESDQAGAADVVVASANGAAHHPGWYHNLAAHPDQASVEVLGSHHRVTIEQLSGTEREQAWAKVVGRAANFRAYSTKTDRQLPVLRLTPVT